MAERTEEREDDDAGTDQELDDLEPTEEDLEDAATPADPPAPTSNRSRRSSRSKRPETTRTRPTRTSPWCRSRPTKGDDRLEPIEARVVPIQSTEFVCKNCYLVKHRSQLADKRRMFCRDCA